MKMTMMTTLMFGCLIFTSTSFANSTVKDIIKPTEEIKPAKKRSRRKKVEMCHECGKPETKCECEGHGEDDSHND